MGRCRLHRGRFLSADEVFTKREFAPVGVGARSLSRAPRSMGNGSASAHDPPVLRVAMTIVHYAA